MSEEQSQESFDDYKSTVILPQTQFAMRAGLGHNEPKIQTFWENIGLFETLRANTKGHEKYILHDGPPYANGAIHIGHALNKILKDLITRTRQMAGYDSHYVPGWDCHGLPIEWKIEELYRAKGQNKDRVSITEFRQECRDFADKWIKEQIQQFKRLGVMGDWQRPYKTMDYRSEGLIVRELGKFLLNGALYSGSKPVLWSVVEKTALADAEVEYYDHKSVTIWVRFNVKSCTNSDLMGASVVIWTTTPWTIPANRAVAFKEGISYGLYRVDALNESSRAQLGERLILADARAQEVAQKAQISELTRLGDAKGLEGTILKHPLFGAAEANGGYDYDVPILMGDYVTDDAGTGFVHIAPGHGIEDYALAHLKHGMEIPMTVRDDGHYYDHVPLFAGLTVYDEKGKVGNHLGPVLKALDENGGLLAKGSQVHSYPHSWRSKAPLIYRNTPQWFISMEKNNLRKKALDAIDATRFIPKAGQNRLRSMIETRPDWCVSRQRLWGVPLPIFVKKGTFEPLRDAEVIERIARAFDEKGGDVWFEGDPRRFLGDKYTPEDWEPLTDVVEVWFDSGSTHAFVLEEREDLHWPADLYLEGTDQHRGWFHTSLLESCGTRGKAPYKAVLTHGFTMDAQGRKMSKSLGNGVDPLKVANQSGADILRLWVISQDYCDDQKIGNEIIKSVTDAYRRLRNTWRFLLGNLSDYQPSMAPDDDTLPQLERYILDRLFALNTLYHAACEAHDYTRIYHAIMNFVTLELSAFYFDVRKDALYCDKADAPRRRACQSVLAHIFRLLTTWLAPVLVHTAEEVWQTRRKDEQAAGLSETLVPEQSVHQSLYPEIPASWENKALADLWHEIKAIRKVITGALELERAQKRIGSSLEAAPHVYLSQERLEKIQGQDWADLAITSSITLAPGPAPKSGFSLDDISGVEVVFAPAQGEKCARCWKILPEVERPKKHKKLCLRCADAL